VVCNDNNPCTQDVCSNGCQFIDERKVLSFTLVDATTDADLGLLNDGDTIDLDVTGPISVRADVCATSDIESVEFLLNGTFYKMENIPFYTIAGDNNGNYLPWNIQPGTYTLRATPHSGDNGSETEGIYHEITIVIIDGVPAPCNGNARQVVDFTLVNAATDQDIGTLADGDTIDLSVTPSINVRANVCHEDSIESVKFLLNGSFHKMENLPFYTIAGDNGNNYLPWNIQPGVYTIRATPHSADNGTGIAGTFHEVTIVIIDGAPCSGSNPEVESLTLVSSSNGTDIGPLVDGMVINLAVTGSINVRANICNGDNAESVQFHVNSVFFRLENNEPYALAGNAGTTYYPWNVQPGVYTIDATPFTGNNATGTAGATYSVTITIIGTAAKMSGPELEGGEALEQGLMLLQAYPNPFRETLHIEFSLPEDSKVKVDIFNIAGQQIATLFEGDVKAAEVNKLEYKPGLIAGSMIIYRLQTGRGSWHGKAAVAR
jgi:hypothetical protein